MLTSDWSAAHQMLCSRIALDSQSVSVLWIEFAMSIICAVVGPGSKLKSCITPGTIDEMASSSADREAIGKEDIDGMCCEIALLFKGPTSCERIVSAGMAALSRFRLSSRLSSCWSSDFRNSARRLPLATISS